MADEARGEGFRRTVPEVGVGAPSHHTKPKAERDTVQLTLSDLTPLAATDGPLQVPADALDDLHLLEEIGRGGMGVVFRALQRSLDREVAVKLMDPRHGWNDAQYERFRTEVLLAASLNHPNVAHIHWVRRERRFVYYVMELVTGDPLDHVLGRHSLSIDEIVPIFRAICDGLEHAHDRGVVHRDLKPGNILLEAGDDLAARRAVLVDFGLAARRGESAINAEGLLMGTPAYMSPEQAGGDTTDHLSDIYSLGVTLFEAVTGRVPFTAKTPLAMALKHLTDGRPDPRSLVPALDPALAELILAMITRDPAARPRSIAEVRERLMAVPRGDTRQTASFDTPVGIASKRMTLMAVELSGFLASANEQPLPRTQFLLESWARLVEDAAAEHQGVVVRQAAARITVAFDGDDDRAHGGRAFAALRDLYLAVRAFNRTHGKRETFTAGLECGPVFYGVVRDGEPAVCFGSALDRSQQLSAVNHLGIGLVGPNLTAVADGLIALDPLIGVADDIGSASLVAPRFLVPG